MQFGPKLRPVGWPRKRKKRREKKVKSQNRYISPPCRGAISQPIFTTFGVFVDLTDVITPTEFGSKIWFFQAERSKKAFSLSKSNGLYNSAMRYRAGL